MSPLPPSAGAPGLAVVVLALGAPPELAGAVRSLLAQDPVPEILVVNSGGGDVAALLRREGLAVPSLERAERLYAGGARNLGIAATRAPFVAFLASDCRADPGWVAERLRLHGAGEAAVASAMLPARESLLGWAATLGLYAGRLPGLPAERALRYGLSYDRALLARLGPFDASLETGEDSAYLRRLESIAQPAWTPGVRTRHLAPAGLGALLQEFHARGRRHAEALRRLGITRPLAAQPLAATLRWVRAQARLGLTPAQWRRARWSLPLVRLCLARLRAGEREG